MVILAWRSQEQAYQLKQRYDTEPKTGGKRFDETASVSAKKKKGSKRRKDTDAQVPRGLPDRFYNEEGEVDLRQVTGDDAWNYFAAQGIKLPRFPGRPKVDSHG